MACRNISLWPETFGALAEIGVADTGEGVGAGEAEGGEGARDAARTRPPPHVRRPPYSTTVPHTAKCCYCASYVLHAATVCCYCVMQRGLDLLAATAAGAVPVCEHRIQRYLILLRYASTTHQRASCGLTWAVECRELAAGFSALLGRLDGRAVPSKVRGRQTHTHAGQTDTHTHRTDRHTQTQTQTSRQTDLMRCVCVPLCALAGADRRVMSCVPIEESTPTSTRRTSDHPPHLLNGNARSGGGGGGGGEGGARVLYNGGGGGGGVGELSLIHI
eukprot:1040799-Rhodomonas_salina.2